MPRKGKKTKHSAAELAAKLAAQKPQGGGALGKDERKPKCALVCLLCKAEIHNLTVMKQHYTAKHPTATCNEADYGGAGSSSSGSAH
jgi:hypothetical protein